MQDLFSFPIPWHLRCKLLRAGITTAEQVRESTAEDISSCARISSDDASTILHLVGPAVSDLSIGFTAPKKTDANQLLVTEDGDTHIRTLCHALDEILNGGIPVCGITEVCGVSGTGKTQLCFQLAVNVQVPRALGGLGGEAMFIDADNGFDVDRMTQVAIATVEHFQEVAAFESNPACLGEVVSFSVDGILKGIHYFRCDDRTQLSAIVNILDDFLTEHQMVRLVIVDSVAFHMREETDKRYAERTGYLFKISQQLARVAIRNSLSVVLTNQMTTRLSDSKDSSYLVPALGDSWSHACPLRFLLLNENNQRTARIVKSSRLPTKTVSFQISSVGIRDVDATGTERTLNVGPSTSTGFASRPNTVQCKRTMTKDSISSISKRPRFSD